MEIKSPTLRFKDFSEPWESASLEETITLISGQHLSPEQYNADSKGTPYFTGPSDFTNDKYGVTKFSCVKSKLAVKDDILITVKGSGVGEMMVLGLPEVAMGRQLMAIRANNKICNIFLFNRLQKNKRQFLALASGNMIPGLSRTDITSTKLFLPSLQEQETVSEFLLTVDHKISLLKEKRALLEQYKKGVMQKLFKQEIRFKDDSGNEFPDWQWKQGNEVFDAISNKSHNSDLPILAITQEHGAIPRDLINYQVQVTDGSVASYKVVEEGDYIISLRSFQGGIEYSRYKGICSPAYIILRPSISIDDDFYRYYLKTGRFIQEMKRRLEGIRDGKILSYKYFSEIRLPYPCIEEQKKISNFINTLDKKLNLVKEQIELTQSFKKGLLQQMFV